MRVARPKKPSLDQLRALSARQQARVDEQNRALARRMHDELSQKTTVLGLELSLLATDAEAPAMKGKIAELAALVTQLSQSIREITNQVYPRVIDDFGLIEALQWYAKSLLANGMVIKVISPAQELCMSKPITQGLFHLAQELICQIFRPIRASELEIRLEQRGAEWLLRLSGEHKGSLEKPEAPEAHLNWLAIEELALRIEGKLKLTTIPGVGTTIVCLIPVKPIEDNQSQLK